MIKVVNHLDEVFNTVTKPFDVNQENAKDLIKDLSDTLVDINRIENRFWLAANEIGYDSCVFAVLANDKPVIICNPSIKNISEQCFIREFFDGKEFIMPRANKVELIYQTEEGKTQCKEFTNESAILICQATDCLVGVHPNLYGLSVTPEFDAATDSEREELLKYYLNELNELDMKLDSELASNSETEEVWKRYQFARGVATGEIELEQVEDKPNRAERRWYNKLLRRFKKRSKNKCE